MKLIFLQSDQIKIGDFFSQFASRISSFCCNNKYGSLLFILMIEAMRLTGQDCTGTPNPGATTSTIASPVSKGISFTLGIANPQSGIGITYQWRISTDGTNYTNILGATNATYTVSAGIETMTYYRCYLKCTKSNTQAWSTPIQISIQTQVKIGSQIWKTNNLNVTKFRNGDPIPEAKTDAEWIAAIQNQKPAWCAYNNDQANATLNGKLYNWFAVKDVRGLAPIGWHIPSNEEWTTLINTLGNGYASMAMRSTNGWFRNANGNNSSGFAAFPGGYRDYTGAFVGIGQDAIWWSTTENTPGYIHNCKLNYNYSIVYRLSSLTYDGVAVRCLKD